MFTQSLQTIGIKVTTPENYKENVSGMKREIAGIIIPKSTKEVSEIVKLANTHKKYLYPISGGKNWAFGSKLPVRENSFIVDLKNLSQVSEINTELGYAVIGAGVTQYQLQKEVEKVTHEYFLDVTGSGRETSVIGNALDRGIAYNSLRADELISCEAVLGTGEIIPLATAHIEDSSTKNIYKHGLGPNLNNLWQQSNFVIVTKATYRLHRRDEKHLFFQAKFNNKDLGAVINKIHKLRSQEVLKGIIHMPDKMRSISSIMPEVVDLNPELLETEGALNSYIDKKFATDWTVFGKISGPKESIKYKKQLLKRALSPLAKVKLFSMKDISFISKVHSLTGNKLEKDFFDITHELVSLSSGKSTDKALKVVNWLPKYNRHGKIDSNENGLLFCVPIFPFTGKDSVQVHNIISDYKKRYPDIYFGTTLNTLNESVVEAVISLSFNKNKDSTKAQDCLKALYKDLALKNYYPYRLNIDNMSDYTDKDSVFWKTVKSIKNALDPNGVISPGRYGL